MDRLTAAVRPMTQAMKKRLLHAVGPLVVLLLFVAAALILHRELEHYRFRDIHRSLAQIPAHRLLLALALTILNYLALTAYDVLALRYVGRRLDYARTALVSFVAYVFSHNVGLSVFGGASIRFRLYSVWGLTALDITKVIAFCGLTLWLGFFTLGGAAFALEPLVLPSSVPLPPQSIRLLGVLLLAA